MRGAQARPAALTTAAVSPTYTAPVMMAAKKEEPWSLGAQRQKETLCMCRQSREHLNIAFFCVSQTRC